MSCDLTLIRNEVYLRINLKRTLGNFNFSNSFILEKTWRPWETLEDIADPSKFPAGKVYVCGGRLGDLINRSRQGGNVAGPRECGVQLGFQIVPKDINDDDELDKYISFVEELENVCRRDTNLHPFSFSRLEYAVTPEGMPLDFIMLRKAMTFECYFTAYFLKVLS